MWTQLGFLVGWLVILLWHSQALEMSTQKHDSFLCAWPSPLSTLGMVFSLKGGTFLLRTQRADKFKPSKVPRLAETFEVPHVISLQFGWEPDISWYAFSEANDLCDPAKSQLGVGWGVKKASPFLIGFIAPFWSTKWVVYSQMSLLAPAWSWCTLSWPWFLLFSPALFPHIITTSIVSSPKNKGTLT